LQIDFNAVGQATNLKSPAARMRYTRLRRQIEGGTLIGTHGTPFSGVAEKMPPEVRKRKRDSQPETGEREWPGVFAKTTSHDRKIKSEPEDFSERYETGSSEGDDSEDEMPLAKRRHDRATTGDESSAMVIRHRGFSSGLHDGQDNHPLVQNGQRDISQSRPEIYGEYVNVPQNNNPYGYLYTPTDHRSEVSASVTGTKGRALLHLGGDDEPKICRGNLLKFRPNTNIDDGLKLTAEMGRQKMVKRKASQNLA
jgi:hypothetical protein